MIRPFTNNVDEMMNHSLSQPQTNIKIQYQYSKYNTNEQRVPVCNLGEA